MSTTEGRARAAMRAIAGTVNDAPPLQLAPTQVPVPDRDLTSAPDEIRFGPRGPAGRPSRKHSLGLRRPGGAPRPGNHGQDRRRSWLAPVTAAAVVVALAVALVIIKDLPNGSAVRPTSSTSSTGPGGIPRYYVALEPTSSKSGAPNGLLVGDSLTGKKIATFAPPAGTTFESVSGAADDRTFVILNVANPDNRALGQADSWYQVKLSPGTAHPATLTYLPIEPRYGVIATALSASGKELAVATDNQETTNGPFVKELDVFSVATGRGLHGWSTKDPTALVPAAWSTGMTQWPALTWIDGDRAIAFSTIGNASPTGTGASNMETVRRLTVGGPLAGDLMADSQVIWTAPATCNADGLPCDGIPPLVSADGKTVTCATLSTREASSEFEMSSWTMTFRTYQLAAGSASGQGTLAYQLTRQVPVPAFGLVAAQWASPSGDTLIGEWAISSNTGMTASPSANGNVAGNASSGETSSSASLTVTDPTAAGLGPAHIGVISHGKFMPLRLPLGFTPVPAGGIAW